MPLLQQTNVLKLPANQNGRDLVIGDIHGCYEDLLRALTELQFDGSVDRCFLVGDLIDRGPDNVKCAELIYEDWCYSVRGNHEDMMIRSLVDNDRNQQMMWVSNGGSWFYQQDRTAMTDLANDLATLPLVITVGERSNRFNVVHAELKKYVWDQTTNWNMRTAVTDEDIDNWTFDQSEQEDMMWGREIVYNSGLENDPTRAKDVPPWHDKDNLSLTFVGHTPCRDAIRVQQHVYIDTGAVFGWKSKSSTGSEIDCLTIAEPNADKLYSYSMARQVITQTRSISEIQQLV